MMDEKLRFRYARIREKHILYQLFSESKCTHTHDSKTSISSFPLPLGGSIEERSFEGQSEEPIADLTISVEESQKPIQQVLWILVIMIYVMFQVTSTLMIARKSFIKRHLGQRKRFLCSFSYCKNKSGPIEET